MMLCAVYYHIAVCRYSSSRYCNIRVLDVPFNKGKYVCSEIKLY
jgi:hypothetical protein